MLGPGFVFTLEILTDENATAHLDLTLQDESERVETNAEEQDTLMGQHLAQALGQVSDLDQHHLGPQSSLYPHFIYSDSALNTDGARPTIRDIGTRTNIAVAEPQRKVITSTFIYSAAWFQHQNTDVRSALEG